jgi:hypothetical protein
MALPELSKTASGTVGISLGVNTVVCSVAPGQRGRFTIRGIGRHTLADGLKLSYGPAGSLVDAYAVLPNAANGLMTIPITTVDLINRTDVVQIRLAVATGGADNASGALSIQLEQSN